MDSSVMRALASAGIFTGIAYVMSGGTHSLADYAITGAFQGASSLGSDTVHQVIMMYPTSVTSAVVTGALFTAAQQLLRGNNDYVSNYAVSAGSEWSARTGQDMWASKKNEDVGAEDVDDQEEY
jgi:hypothetical protein